MLIHVSTCAHSKLGHKHCSGHLSWASRSSPIALDTRILQRTAVVACTPRPPTNPPTHPPARPYLAQLHAATQLLDAVTRPVLSSVRGASGATWPTLRAHLLGALEELVSAFPQDYYPPPRPLDPSHVDAFRDGVAELCDAWRELAGGDSAQAAPAAQLYAALILGQLQDLCDALARLHASCAAAMASLEGSLFGFMGLRCCAPAC